MPPTPAHRLVRRGLATDRVTARRTLAAVLVAHGLAHLAGAGYAFSRAAERRSASYLAGGWHVSDPAVLRLFGVAWALLALAFVLSAVVTWRGSGRWPVVVWWVSLVSLVLLTVSVWSSVVGILIDGALLVGIWRAGLLRPKTGGHGR